MRISSVRLVAVRADWTLASLTMKLSPLSSDFCGLPFPHQTTVCVEVGVASRASPSSMGVDVLLAWAMVLQLHISSALVDEAAQQQDIEGPAMSESNLQ